MKKAALLLTALVLFAIQSTRAADTNELIKETQKLVQEPKKMLLVWWIPTEFWTLTFKNDPRITDAQRTDLTTTLDKYTVIVVFGGDFGPMADLKARSREEIIQNTELRVNDKIIPLLDPKDISPSAINFVSLMKPLLANMMGTMGQGLEFLLYSNDQNGAKLIDPIKPGGFTYTAFGNKFAWRLPLGSLLPPKMDSATKEEFPGNYLFNPFTGSKLVLKDSPVKN